MSLASLAGGGGDRNQRQKDIAARAHQKLGRLRQLGSPGVSAGQVTVELFNIIKLFKSCWSKTSGVKFRADARRHHKTLLEQV